MVELTTQLLILENILWLPLCRINKFGLNTLLSKAVAIPYTCGLSLGKANSALRVKEEECGQLAEERDRLAAVTALE